MCAGQCFAQTRGKNTIQREAILVTRQGEQKQKESQAGNDVLVERVQGIVEKVAKGDHD